MSRANKAKRGEKGETLRLNGREGGGDVCRVHRQHSGRGGVHTHSRSDMKTVGNGATSRPAIIPSDSENIKVYLPPSALSLAPWSNVIMMTQVQTTSLSVALSLWIDTSVHH